MLQLRVYMPQLRLSTAKKERKEKDRKIILQDVGEINEREQRVQ